MTIHRSLILLSVLTIVLLPAAASAQFGVVDTFIDDVGSFIGAYLIPLVFGIALLVFIWGMFTYFILGGGDERKREEGKALALYAIMGFVIMVVIWGIVNLLAGGLISGLGGGKGTIKGLDTLPQTPTQ